MKKEFWVILILYMCCKHAAFAQVSQGGVPLFLDRSLLRSSSEVECIEMPSFNVDSVKQIDELNKGNMRTAFQFAHKFYTRIEKGKQGNMQVLSDGTRVWQVSIRSKGAYSINLLFTKFRLPEGGKLFIYNAGHSHVIGAFDHRNNSPENILPIRPVAGDVLTVEYSEPANAAFEGELIIGEVNHDYRDILRSKEPGTDQPEFTCMPDVLCTEADERIIRSTVLLVINGTTLCSGSLVNNTNNDETPYLLTAVHCLNEKLSSDINPDYDYMNISGTIIAFFNYNRPVCETQMKATEEMSLAGAYSRAIIDRKDVALLELKDKPPVHYNAYYAGWNMLVDDTSPSPPYTNIHHPNGTVKKYGQSTQNLFSHSWGHPFDNYAHLAIPFWDIGATHAGSSGSPLFDKDYRIVGTLTGGCSSCTTQSADCTEDYFTALYQSWTDHLKMYLDPVSTNTLQQDGYDPHAKNPLIRASNADYNHGDELIRTQLAAPGTGLLFGKNSFNFEEAAEEFNLNQASEILGVYILIPPMPVSHTSGVKIKIYEGAGDYKVPLGEKAFIPQYRNYNDSSFVEKNKNTQSVPTETFVAFDEPVRVNRQFFVAYTINGLENNEFVVYNTGFAASGKPNTAWVMKSGQWAKVTESGISTTPTSLALQPLVRYTTGDSISETHEESGENWYYSHFLGKLFLNSETKNGGEIFIYAVNGQLIEKISFSKGEKSFELPSRPPGSIGIVKIIQDNKVISKKILH